MHRVFLGFLLPLVFNGGVHVAAQQTETIKQEQTASNEHDLILKRRGKDYEAKLIRLDEKSVILNVHVDGEWGEQAHPWSVFSADEQRRLRQVAARKNLTLPQSPQKAGPAEDPQKAHEQNAQELYSIVDLLVDVGNRPDKPDLYRFLKAKYQGKSFMIWFGCNGQVQKAGAKWVARGAFFHYLADDQVLIPLNIPVYGDTSYWCTKLELNRDDRDKVKNGAVLRVEFVCQITNTPPRRGQQRLNNTQIGGTLAPGDLVVFGSGAGWQRPDARITIRKQKITVEPNAFASPSATPEQMPNMNWSVKSAAYIKQKFPGLKSDFNRF